MLNSLLTERLCIREFELGDSKKLFELYRLPETSQFESWQPFTTELETRDLLNDWIRQQRQSSRREYTLAITHKNNPDLIGLCGLDLGVGVETDDVRVGFLSYRLFPAEWHKGYATEVVRELIRMAFDDMNLHRVHSGCALANISSSRVLEKAGLALEGQTRQSFPIENEWSDYLLFGLLQQDYKKHF